MANSKHTSGFVSLLGRPNAGKSTLLNALVGEKLAIVADKPQTTRTTVQGVLTRRDTQIVFLDTPGIHQAEGLLNRRMMDVVRGALEERDLLLYLVDATKPFGPSDAQAISLLNTVQVPAYLLLNKVDIVKAKHELLTLIEEYRQLHAFEEYLPVSGKKGEGLEALLDLIAARLPKGPALFPEDYLTDQPERFRAAEFIREQVLRETRQEVPHSVAVLIDEWRQTPQLARITATIVVEREGQKAIIIGLQGQMLKKIGTQARLELEKVLGCKVYLELYVKVREEWRESPRFLNELDWERTTPALLSTEADKESH